MDWAPRIWKQPIEAEVRGPAVGSFSWRVGLS